MDFCKSLRPYGRWLSGIALTPNSSPDVTSREEVCVLHIRLISDAYCSYQIDQLMLQLPSISTSVRRLKNSLAPINRLPPEILTLVLTFRHSERDLIVATAICRHWRRTLVSTPNLWNNVVCPKTASVHTIVPRLRTYFERSRSVPVNIQIHARASRLLSPHIDRISGLSMFVDNRWDIDKIAESLSKPAPLLETVNFWASYQGPRGLVLPPFFQPLLYSTKTLDLRYIGLSPGRCQLTKLTRFTLKTFLIGSSSALLLDTLEQMPLLQVFEASFYRTNQHDPVPDDRVVTLPHLEDITITIDENRLPPVPNQILPALSLPSVRRVLLQLTNARGAPLTPILPLSFQERLPRLRDTPKVLVALDSSYISIGFLGLDSSRLKLRANSSEIYAFTQSTFGGTPFDSVRKLRISFRSSAVDTIFFIKLLRSMKGMNSLRMEQNTTGPLARWIEEDEQAGICPALASLIIIDSDLDTAKQRVEELKGIRERAGVPIVEIEAIYYQN